HQPQLPRAAGEQLAGELREVAGRRLEGLVEGLPYLTVGVPDHGAQLAQRGLRVRATGLHLLDVSHGLRVLFLREWIDRTQLLAPARQALDPREKRPPLLLVQAGARPRGLAAGARLIALPGVGARPCLRLGEPQALGDLFQLQLRLADLVAQA